MSFVELFSLSTIQMWDKQPRGQVTLKENKSLKHRCEVDSSTNNNNIYLFNKVPLLADPFKGPVQWYPK